MAATASTTTTAIVRFPRLPFFPYSNGRVRSIPARRHRPRLVAFAAVTRKLAEAEPVRLPEPGADNAAAGGAALPAAAGVYAVYDAGGELQFLGISRNVAAAVDGHRRKVPAELCASVKVGLTEEEVPDRATLTGAWKSWMEQHIAATGKPPPGNVAGNTTWVDAPRRPPDIHLTPGRHVQLTVPLEELIDRLVKEQRVVAFIKGSRSAPQCGFSQRVVSILESHSVDFATVDVLDEEHNYGLRETLKKYSNWPTFPQVFLKGELVGGCDIISSLADKGELAAAFRA